MSAELAGAAKQLIVILQRYFRPSGHPPEMPKWLFVVSEARAVASQGVGIRSGTFAALVESEPSDPYLREALEKIPQLQETAETLKVVLRIIDDGDVGDSRFAYLIRRLLETRWMKSRTASIVHEDSGIGADSHPEPNYFGYAFSEIGLGFLDQLRESIDEINVSDTSRAAQAAPQLTFKESCICEAIGSGELSGQQIADKAGFTWNSSLRSTLSNMVKRELLVKGMHGYRVP